MMNYQEAKTLSDELNSTSELFNDVSVIKSDSGYKIFSRLFGELKVNKIWRIGN